MSIRERKSPLRWRSSRIDLRYRGLKFVVAWFLLTIWFAADCENLYSAIPPRRVSEQQLAASPIIVVAQWERTPAAEPPTKDGPFVASTKLRVLRTVKGANIPQGEYDLLLGREIGWNRDGKFLSSATSSEMLGDAEDITVPCLWFLDRAKALDASSSEDALTIDSYRKIQPLELEEYYLALGSKDAERNVPGLLEPGKLILGSRVLEYISGGSSWRFEKGKILVGEASRVWKIVQSPQQELRPLAASVYADLRGAECVGNLRSLVKDANPSVRLTAIGILAKHRDDESIRHFEQAIQGIEDVTLLCGVIEELSNWKDERLVPALIQCLQNSGSPDFHDDDWIPALKARKVLREITDCWFPLDVEKSLNAWGKANDLAAKGKRSVVLAELLDFEEHPLIAELVGEPIYSLEKPEDGNVSVRVRIRNTSHQELTITRIPFPCLVSMAWSGGSLSLGIRSDEVPSRPQDFVQIAPDGSHEIQVAVSSSFLVTDSNNRSLKISFHSHNARIETNQWVGSLEVNPSDQWKEVREEKDVQEKWANGNLKVTGKTMNGQKIGAWHHFNEQGDRIKIENHNNGQGNATCNPDHPTNKGAGKREK